MGLLDFLPTGPLSPFIKGLKRPLNDIGYGMVKGKNWQDGLAQAADYSAQMQPYRDAETQRQEQIQQAADEKNQTVEWLNANHPDLGAMVAQGMPVGEAWGEALRRQQPKQGGDGFTLGEGQVRYDAAGNIIASGPEAMPDPKDALAQDKEAFDRESALFKEYAGADAVKTYEVVKGGYQRVREGAQLDNGAGDMAVIYGFMKMNDPGSVVRESEFAMAAQSGSLGEQIKGFVNQVLTGGRLDPAVRQRMVEASGQLYSATAADLAALNEQFGRRATGWDVDANRFIRQPEAFEPLKLGGPAIDMGNGITIRRIK